MASPNYDNPGQINDEALNIAGGKTFQVIQLADPDGNVIDPTPGVIDNVTIENVQIGNTEENPVPVEVAELPLPDGAATEETLASIDGKVPSDLTVSDTRLLVDGSGVTQPVSGTVNTLAALAIPPHDQIIGDPDLETPDAITYYLNEVAVAVLTMSYTEGGALLSVTLSEPV